MNKRIDELLDQIDVNPKIRELAEQAGCSIDRLGFGEGHLEKFAELIVQECIKVMDVTAKDAQDHFTYMGDDVPTTVHQIEIKKHFGVK